MPLCTGCKHEALEGVMIPTRPPHGMAWGETCDECGVTAEVTIRV